MRRVVVMLVLAACSKPRPAVAPTPAPPPSPSPAVTPVAEPVDELAARASHARRTNDPATADRLVTQLAHGAPLGFAIPETALGVPTTSPDGSVWVAAKELSPIRIRSTWTGLAIAEIPAIEGRSRDTVVPVDRTHVVTTSLDAVTILGTDGSIIDLIAPCTDFTAACDGRQYQSLSVAVNGQRIAVVGDHEIAIYNLAGKKLAAVPRESKNERGRRVLWQGTTLAIAAGRIELWDTTSTLATTGTVEGVRIWENAFALSGDGERVALRGRDPAIQIYDRAGKLLSKIDKVYASDLAYIGQTLYAFQPSFREVFRIDGDRAIKLAERIELSGHWAIARDRIVTTDGVMIPSATGIDLITHVEPAHEIGFLAWSSTGSRLAVAAGNRDLAVLDASGAIAIRDEIPVRGSFAFRPSSDELWWITREANIAMWNLGSTGPIAGHQPVELKGTSTALAFDPQGKRLLRQPADKDLEIVTAADGKPEQSIHVAAEIGTFTLDQAAFLDGGRRLLLSDTLTATLWNASLKVEVWRARERVLAASSNAALLILSGIDDVRVFDVGKQQGLGTISHKGVVLAAFSPDDKTLALGSRTGEVALVDVASLHVTKTFHAHASAITALAWRPDGKLLATGSEGGGLALWSPDGTAEASIAIGTTNATKRPEPKENEIVIGEVDVGPHWVALFPDGQAHGSELGYRFIAAFSNKTPLATGLVIPAKAAADRWARLFRSN